MKRIKILARKKLNMSPGKLAAQSVHAALALGMTTELHAGMSVVVLMVNEGKFEQAKKENSPVAIVQDAGYTEVPAGTETCIAFLEDDPRITSESICYENKGTAKLCGLRQFLDCDL